MPTEESIAAFRAKVAQALADLEALAAIQAHAVELGASAEDVASIAALRGNTVKDIARACGELVNVTPGA